MSFSSIGKQDQQYFLWPILYTFWGLKLLGLSPFMIQNLSFSLIFVLGFVFFQKLLQELLPNNKKYRAELLLGGMMYVFSPIILITPVRSYLAPIWLIGTLPLFAYLLVRYLKTRHVTYLALSALSAGAFSISLNAIPWLLGFILPLSLGLVFASQLFSRTEKLTFLKGIAIWSLTIFLSQAFWLLPFASSMAGGNSLGGYVFGQEVGSSFDTTVTATDQGNTIIDPLLNLFHQQIQQNFSWSSYSTYTHWYDHLIPLSSVYVLIFILGLLRSNKRSSRIFWIILCSFLVSLFLFTVRIGNLETLFLAAGKLPGFAMFRNFYNKFALGYVLLYAAIITLSLAHIKHAMRRPLFSLLLAAGFLAVALNAVPFFTGQITNSNLQDTAHIQRNIHLPGEYLSFMKAMGKDLPQNANVLDMPFGTSAYTIIAEPGTNHAYSGKSPVKLFSGVNDFSGNLSFPEPIADQVNAYIQDRDYPRLLHLLSALHINYIFQTNNIPQELLQSSLFDQHELPKIDAQFHQQIYGKRLLISSNGNYSLYRVKGGNESLPNDSFVPVTTTYGVSPDLLPSTGSSFLPGPLGFLLDATNIGIEKSPATQNLTNATLSPFSLGDKIDNPNNDTIYVPHDNLFRIVKSDQSGTLSLQSIAESAYTDSDRTTTISVGKLSDTNLINVNNEYYTLADLNGAVVSDNDHIAVLGKDNNATSNASVSTSAPHWAPGDCSPHNNGRAVSITRNNQAGEISITSKDGHVGCLFSDLQTKGSQTYVITFRYKTDTAGASMEIIQNGKLVGAPFRAAKPGQWSNFTYTFKAKTGSARLYLISNGSSQIANTAFQNIQIHEFGVLRTFNMASYHIDTSESNKFAARSVAKGAPPTSTVSTPPLPNWSRADCNALDSNSALSFSNTGKEGKVFELKANNGHDACIRMFTDTDTDYTYSVDFDYESTGGNGNFAVSYIYGPGFPLQRITEPNPHTGWHHVSLTLSPPLDAKNLTLYLYSGESVDGSSSIEYENFAIERVPKTFSDNLLISRKRATGASPHVSSYEVAPHKYRVSVSSAKGGFFINFLEPYHAGWRLSMASVGRGGEATTLPHLEANIYTNGWYVDPAQLCKNNSGCTRNRDGSYNFKLIAEFAPQRWFYVGSIISGLTFVGCVGYLWRYFKHRRQERSEHYVARH
jgi:hypothetical protein